MIRTRHGDCIFFMFLNILQTWWQRLLRSRVLKTLGQRVGRWDAQLDRWSDRIEDAVVTAVRWAAARAAPWVRRAKNRGRIIAARSVARMAPVLRIVARNVPRHVTLAVMTIILSWIAWRLWMKPPMSWIAEWMSDPVFAAALANRHLPVWLRTTHAVAGLLAALQGLTALAAIVGLGRRATLWGLKASAAGGLLLWFLAARLAAAIPAALNSAPTDLYGAGMRNEAWVTSWWYLVPSAILLAGYVLLVGQGATRRIYGGADTPSWADRILLNLRTHGADPRFRRAQYQSLWWHVFFILILPFLLFWLRLMESPYEIPKGSGEPVLELVRIRKVEKKPKERYFLNPDSAISFYIPKIEDSEVFEQVDEMTKNLYEATQIGALGDGGGKTGGWPDGMENARVRFIRLEYDGGDWNHNMGFGYDYNMLLQFRRLTGFNIWPETESIRMTRLLHFPRGRAPPFVYLTGGMRGALQVSEPEVRALRRYCLELGGMLLADNAGGRFDSQFRALLRRAFPELPLVEIANDDLIFRQPYIFPEGAPPLWHHSGMRAMGVKHRGRWVVFYHQGELSDAWRDTHSGISSGLAMQAYKMGINVIYYAFTQYMRINHPQRR